MQCGPFILLSLIVGLFTPWPELLGTSASDTETMPMKCTFPPEYGKCNNFYENYYYDVKSKMCRTFTYSGCGGNGNNFISLIKCLEECKKFGVPASWQSPKGLPPKCKEQVENGPCLALGKAYYYDNRMKICQEYEYGGCGASRNHFESFRECYEECQKYGSPEFLINPDLLDEFVLYTCGQPLNTGSCEKSFLRFYYDAQTEKCKPFKYGGCNGNENNFRTEEECSDTCGPYSRFKIRRRFFW